MSVFLLQEIPQQLPEVDLPGGVSPFLRAFFSVPQGVQMVGGALAVIVGIAIVWLVIRNRRALLAWFRSRSKEVRGALIGVAVVSLTLFLMASRVSWNYMQHDNEFCTGCHVMGPAYERFTSSGHAELSCHDCHRQSIFASMRQLHLWVRDRPEEIGEHSPVPSEICRECHEADDPADNWPQVAATAGHLAHFESDSNALEGVQCVTCHGQEVHQFLPADQTCGQADCHASETTQIVLGDMTGEAGLHCVVCHEFTATRVAPSGIDAATGLLTPGLERCLGCHEMESLWADYDPTMDPHEAKCGACHNPHEQERPEVALRACTDAGCHARPDTLSTFHIGLGDVVEDDCTGCHEPHVWVRDGNDCGSCHTEIPGAVASAPGPRPDGAAALPARHPGVSAPATAWLAATRSPIRPPEAAAFRHVAPPDGEGPFPSGRVDAAVGSAVPFTPHEGSGAPPGRALRDMRQDPFTHEDHRNVQCTDCHSNRRTHGEILVRTQSDCFQCHHSTRTGSAGCGQCHQGGDLAGAQVVTERLSLSVWDGDRTRGMSFRHTAHGSLRCVDCHGGGVRQAVQTSCASCHADHHGSEAETACVDCHEEHREDAHTEAVHIEGCTGAGCHAQPEFSRMDRTREFCSVCHQAWRDHEPGAPCVECHLVPASASVRRE